MPMRKSIAGLFFLLLLFYVFATPSRAYAQSILIRDVNGELNGADGYFRWQVRPAPGERVGAVVITLGAKISLYDLQHIAKPPNWVVHIPQSGDQIIFSRGEHGDYLSAEEPSIFGFYIDLAHLSLMGGTGRGYLTLLNDYKPGAPMKTLNWAVVRVPGIDIPGAIEPGEGGGPSTKRKRSWLRDVTMTAGFFLHAKSVILATEKEIVRSPYANINFGVGTSLNLYSTTRQQNEPRYLRDIEFPLFFGIVFVQNTEESDAAFRFSLAACGITTKMEKSTKFTYGLRMRTEILPFYDLWSDRMTPYLSYGIFRNPYEKITDFPLDEDLSKRYFELLSVGLMIHF